MVKKAFNGENAAQMSWALHQEKSPSMAIRHGCIREFPFEQGKENSSSPGWYFTSSKKKISFFEDV